MQLSALVGSHTLSTYDTWDPGTLRTGFGVLVIRWFCTDQLLRCSDSTVLMATGFVNGNHWFSTPTESTTTAEIDTGHLWDSDSILISVSYCVLVIYSLLPYCTVDATASLWQVRQLCCRSDRMSNETVNWSSKKFNRWLRRRRVILKMRSVHAVQSASVEWGQT